MRKSLIAASLLAVTVAVAPACATKGFVREEVGAVNTKVDTVSTTVEQTQARLGQAEQRIGAVDQKAEAAGKSATAAQTTADQARTAADQARTAADQAAQNARTVGTRVEAVEAATRRLVFEVTLSEDQGNFRFGGAELPDEAKAGLDGVINRIKANPANVYIEIEGHTDNVGAETLNDQLGLERAEAVKRYLYEQHQVPLHKISVISYGESKPVAPNNTRDGRAQNRRVVVRILS